jgi:hypothetical protein
MIVYCGTTPCGCITLEGFPNNQCRYCIQ